MLIAPFEDPKFTDGILAELARLEDQDLIRVIDMMALRKEDDGSVEVRARAGPSACRGACE